MAETKITTRVAETTQTTGTGTLDLDGAQTGYRSFADELTSGDETWYTIADDASAPTVYEVGRGTFTAGSPNTLSRDVVSVSSNGGNKISLQAGVTYIVNGSPPDEFLDRLPPITTQATKLDDQASQPSTSAGQVAVFSEGGALKVRAPSDGDVAVIGPTHLALPEQVSAPSTGANEVALFNDAGEMKVRAESDGAVTGLSSLPRSYLAGLGTAVNSTDAAHDIDIAAGVCRSADNTADIELTSALTKRLDATWSAGTGNGGRSSSVSLTADTWYHVFAILVGGSADVGFDTSLTAANLVADHSATAYRRIWSILTNSSANVVAYFQSGDEGLWLNPPLDVDATQSTTANLRTLSVPTGFRVWAHMTSLVSSSATRRLYINSPDANDEAPSAAAAPLATHSVIANEPLQIPLSVMTNTSGQVRTRADGASTTLRISTLGWTDWRGRND